MVNAPAEQRSYIRELARRVAHIAASDENAQAQQRWRDVNALRKPDRAPVWCRPVGAWAELLPDAALVCSDPWLREVETFLRRLLIKHDIGDDEPVYAWYPVRAVFQVDPPNTWGVTVRRRESDEIGGAWAFDPPLKEEADLDRLRLPRFAYDEAKTQAALDQVHELFRDILDVRLVCDAPLDATLGPADLRGLTQMMIDMIDQPHVMHRLMAYLRDATLGAMDQVAQTGLLTPNNLGPMICSDPVGEPDPTGRVHYRNMWVMANSQEFDQVSPAMWEEFCLNYQKPILERFGLSAYGCCENLTRKIDGVLSIANLRIFVCSAWTNLDKVLQAVNRDYVVMWRQKASEVVFPEDTDTIRRDLETGLRRLQGYYYQVVLRELQTLCGHPDRLHQWTRLAKELAARYA